MTKNTKSLENKGDSIYSHSQNGKTHLYSIGKKHYIHPTKYLTPEQVDKLFKASEKAYDLRCPLNRFITIHYDDFAGQKRPQDFIIRIMEHTRKWLGKRGFPVAYVYVLEKGKYKGIHAHILLHIPAKHQRDYKKALRGWLPFEWTRKRVQIRTVKYPHYGELSPLNGIYGNLRYMCKGITPDNPIRDIEPKYQGEIYGQRYGISRLLQD